MTIFFPQQIFLLLNRVFIRLQLSGFTIKLHLCAKWFEGETSDSQSALTLINTHLNKHILIAKACFLFLDKPLITLLKKKNHCGKYHLPLWLYKESIFLKMTYSKNSGATLTGCNKCGTTALWSNCKINSPFRLFLDYHINAPVKYSIKPDQRILTMENDKFSSWETHKDFTLQMLFFHKG